MTDSEHGSDHGRSGNRLPKSYFDAVYGDRLDPWGFESTWYEERKRAITLAALPKARYERAFEPGCAIGVLTRELASRCDEVVAWDVHPAVVDECARRCADVDHVDVTVGAIPDRWPAGRFDLVVLSEVAYYLDRNGLEALAAHLRGSSAANGTVVAVHWLGETDYPLTGTETHERLEAELAWTTVVHHVDEDFVLDVWERR